jgi:hypothetical protein
MTNALMVIYPYKYEGLWVFDDKSVGLEKEPFVAGADILIENAVKFKGIKNSESGFRLIFSKTQFPNYDFKFEWLREGDGGNWYRSEQFNMDGWLCPALLKYFDAPPKEIYVRFEAK